MNLYRRPSLFTKGKDDDDVDDVAAFLFESLSSLLPDRISVDSSFTWRVDNDPYDTDPRRLENNDSDLFLCTVGDDDTDFDDDDKLNGTEANKLRSDFFR
jgi:hypothetical protein